MAARRLELDRSVETAEIGRFERTGSTRGAGTDYLGAVERRALRSCLAAMISRIQHF